MIDRDTTATPRSFEAVHDEQRLAIERLAYLVVRRNAVAEELAQEAFLRLHQRFDEVRNPPGFLRTVVVRLALSWVARRDMESARYSVLGATPETTVDEPDEVWDALARLRPERTIVLVLRYYEDMPYREIARTLGCSSATARSRVRRALQDLRRELTR